MNIILVECRINGCRNLLLLSRVSKTCVHFSTLYVCKIIADPSKPDKLKHHRKHGGELHHDDIQNIKNFLMEFSTFTPEKYILQGPCPLAFHFLYGLVFRFTTLFHINVHVRPCIANQINMSNN